MVAAYHLIWTVYGYWLPNDPRGSTSSKIRCAKIAPLGELHHGRKQIQPSSQEIRDFHQAARGVLKHKLLTFSSEDVNTIASGFANAIKKRNYTCYACAIMPDHVHLVIRKHRDVAEAMIEHFQNESKQQVHSAANSQHASDHPVWGGPGWKVYLDTQDDISRTIQYVEQNPVKIRQPTQTWEFVTPYDGWLPGQVKIVRRTKPQAEG